MKKKKKTVKAQLLQGVPKEKVLWVESWQEKGTEITPVIAGISHLSLLACEGDFVICGGLGG